MISKQDLERLVSRPPGDAKILSLFLDMSVNSDNKRTFQVFVNQKRAEFQELDSDRRNHHVEPIGEAFERIQQWIEDEFDEENRGIAFYTEIGGDWFEALQFPVPITNRMIINDRPAIAPLAQVLESYHHHGVVVLDREHVRILSVYLGTLLDEIEVRGDPFPAPNDVQAGGYSQKRYQRRKAEEMRHFFREFSKEVEEFVRRYKADDLVILGTDENVAKFKEFLSDRLREMVVYTGPVGVDDSASEVLARIEPHLKAEREREAREVVEVLLDRVGQGYLATAGFQSTLAALQEGKVDTLVVARDHERNGARCPQCGFVFARNPGSCPYDGTSTEEGVDVVEEMVRMAEEQDSEVEFVEPGAVAEVGGVGALLRF
ncbi:MAG TPA: VLRF1 family aeRF1-type release factor [Longimicrobiaceae bacterium]|nr:VLRF1 family aeRF1-type release factor [Longimicrobiaceae bacterium]